MIIKLTEIIVMRMLTKNNVRSLKSIYMKICLLIYLYFNIFLLIYICKTVIILWKIFMYVIGYVVVTP